MPRDFKVGSADVLSPCSRYCISENTGVRDDPMVSLHSWQYRLSRVCSPAMISLTTWILRASKLWCIANSSFRRLIWKSISFAIYRASSNLTTVSESWDQYLNLVRPDFRISSWFTCHVTSKLAPRTFRLDVRTTVSWVILMLETIQWCQYIADSIVYLVYAIHRRYRWPRGSHVPQNLGVFLIRCVLCHLRS